MADKIAKPRLKGSGKQYGSPLEAVLKGSEKLSAVTQNMESGADKAASGALDMVPGFAAMSKGGKLIDMAFRKKLMTKVAKPQNSPGLRENPYLHKNVQDILKKKDAEDYARYIENFGDGSATGSNVILNVPDVKKNVGIPDQFPHLADKNLRKRIFEGGGVYAGTADSLDAEGRIIDRYGRRLETVNEYGARVGKEDEYWKTIKYTKTLEDIVDPITDDVIVKAGETISPEHIKTLREAGITRVNKVAAKPKLTIARPPEK